MITWSESVYGNVQCMCLKEVESRECSIKEFMAFMEDIIGGQGFQKVLDTKGKLEMCKLKVWLGKGV